MTLGEIAQHVKLSKSTVRRLLLTLQQLGLVTGNPARGATAWACAVSRLARSPRPARTSAKARSRS